MRNNSKILSRVLKTLSLSIAALLIYGCSTNPVTHRVAYENYDQAVAAFAEDNLQQAAVLVDKAISVEPRESLFYGLRARIYQKKGNTKHALADVNRAITLNPDYWQYYLTRGAIQEKLGNPADAITDLKKSVALLPTVEAYYSLGRLSLANNQREQAIGYFWEAWDSSSDLSIEAGKILARLDLEENPDDYLEAFVTLDGDKNIVIEVVNNAELPVQVLEVKLQKMRDTSFETFERYSVEETITSGDSLALTTPVGPVKGKKMYKYRASVAVARVAE